MIWIQKEIGLFQIDEKEYDGEIDSVFFVNKKHSWKMRVDDDLNISEKYLNECVKEVLSINAKQLIIEQLLMKSRRALKFSDLSIKEVSYNLGFSSPEYFSSFFKKHTGSTPSQFRNN